MKALENFKNHIEFNIPLESVMQVFWIFHSSWILPRILNLIIKISYKENYYIDLSIKGYICEWGCVYSTFQWLNKNKNGTKSIKGRPFKFHTFRIFPSIFPNKAVSIFKILLVACTYIIFHCTLDSGIITNLLM